MGRTSPVRRSPRLLAISVVALLSLFGCDADDGSGPEEAVTREDVAESGRELVGQTVTVTGVVNDEFGGGALEIAGEGAFFDGADVLVVGRNLPPVAAGARVEVTGVVRSFDPEGLEAEIGTDLPVSEGSYETAIVASDTRVLEPGGTMDPE